MTKVVGIRKLMDPFTLTSQTYLKYSSELVQISICRNTEMD